MRKLIAIAAISAAGIIPAAAQAKPHHKPKHHHRHVSPFKTLACERAEQELALTISEGGDVQWAQAWRSYVCR